MIGKTQNRLNFFTQDCKYFHPFNSRLSGIRFDYRYYKGNRSSGLACSRITISHHFNRYRIRSVCLLGDFGWDQCCKRIRRITCTWCLAGILVINPAVGDISLFGENLLPGRGGLIGVLFAAIFIALVEKQVRKFIPQSLDIILTPTIALLITGIVTYIVFMPVGGFLSDAITNGLLNVLDFGGVVAGFVLGAAFLPLVITGLHQGLTPVHLELINSIGDDPLLPILAMGGAGQVGAAFAIYMKTKKASLKRAIGGGLPSGMLGIGEPLIFGVTLPLGRPFLTACLGAGVGGAFKLNSESPRLPSVCPDCRLPF